MAMRITESCAWRYVPEKREAATSAVFALLAKFVLFGKCCGNCGIPLAVTAPEDAMKKKLWTATFMLMGIVPALAQMSGMTMTSPTNPASKAYMQEMSKMHDSTMGMKPTNDTNKDFVMMMKPHHQAAVDMANTYLKYGKDPELLKMSKDIVSSQEAEIKMMTQWQMKHDH